MIERASTGYEDCQDRLRKTEEKKDFRRAGPVPITLRGRVYSVVANKKLHLFPILRPQTKKKKSEETVLVSTIY